MIRQLGVHHKQNGEYPLWYFHLLENLYSALEEMAFPLPNEFVEHFSLVAFDVLPKRKFVQYVNKDIVCITDKVLKRILEKYRHLDPELLYLLVRKLQDKDTELAILEGLKVQQGTLMEYYHSVLSTGVNNPNELQQLYSTMLEQQSSQSGESLIPNESFGFQPLAFYLLSMYPTLDQDHEPTMTQQSNSQVPFAHRKHVEYVYEHAHKELPHFLRKETR
jgi:hypothetical protein